MAYTPNPDRKVKDGKAMVSAKELADFKSQYGEDKSLRDLLNADKGLRRRGEDSVPAKKADPVKEVAPAKDTSISSNEGRGSVTTLKSEDADTVSKPADVSDKPKRGFGPYNVGSGIGDFMHKTFTREGREEVTKEAKQNFKKGGSVSASSRGDGIAQRGKTRGKMC